MSLLYIKMSGIEIIIGAVVYVTTNAILAGVLMLLKKFDTKKFLGLMNEFKTMGEKVQSMGDKSNTLYELLSEQKETSERSLLINEPYDSEGRQVIYLDELIKKGKLSAHGYDLLISKTPRTFAM